MQLYREMPCYANLVYFRLWIYNSILYSAYATYGDVDPAAAQGVLARLDIPADTEDLADLSERLAEMKRRGLTRWRVEAELDLRLGPTLEEHRVAPDSTQLRDELATADDAESDPLVEREARVVLREDRRLQRPDATRGGVVCEASHQRRPDSAPPRV